ncbi:MAG: glucuronate isomerase [Actinomycetaceae bacterium]|nr:glucuronate isomerase [Actinomycetaceae bacterium]
MSEAKKLQAHPDRLFPAEANARAAAREIYAGVKDLPIISPHGHVPIQWLTYDIPFSDPTSLLITPDHYVNRMMHANGVPLSELGVGVPAGSMSEADNRRAFKHLCSHWKDYYGTPVRFWLESELVEIFGITTVPSAETSDAIYDQINAALATDAYRPRALWDRFKIEFIATTDDPCDSLDDHVKLANDPAWKGRAVPTFRPDRYLEPARADWVSLVGDLGRVADVDTGSYDGYVEAMRLRRLYFKERGAVSTDHSHVDAGTLRLDLSEARRIYADALRGQASPEECHALQRHLLNDQARLAVEDGLVMTLHPAVVRNHHQPTFEKYGADVGADIPMSVEFARGLQPMLNDYGTAEGFHLVVFTMDETVYSRELAPLAGFYPSVYVGAPWWFIDEADAISRFRRSVTGAAGFTRTSGFIDDTRAYLSIPARHDMSRRLDCGYLGNLVAEHRLTLDEAVDVAYDLVVTQPKKVFKL